MRARWLSSLFLQVGEAGVKYSMDASPLPAGGALEAPVLGSVSDQFRKMRRRPSGRRPRLARIGRRKHDCVVDRDEQTPLADPADEMREMPLESLDVDVVKRGGLTDRDLAR